MVVGALKRVHGELSAAPMCELLTLRARRRAPKDDSWKEF
jgi:hypothetical protein